VEDIETAFRELRGTLDVLMSATGLKLRLQELVEDVRWEVRASTALVLEGKRVGTLGQLGAPYQKAFGIDRPVMMLHLDLETLLPHMRHAMRYEPVAEFPAAQRDLAIAVEEKVSYGEIEEVMRSGSQLLESIELVEIYRGQGVEAGQKSLTIALTFRAADRTLSSEEVDEAVNQITKMLQEQFRAILR